MGRENSKTHTCIGTILELCPNAIILLLLKNARDVAFSIRDRTGSIQAGIIRWVEDNRAGREFWSHPSVYVFKYESLIESFESTVKGVLEFLGEEYEDGVKAYHKTPRYYYSNKIEKPETAFGKNHDQYRNWQINQPLFDGTGKWKRMSEEEISIVDNVAKEMLIECGYVESRK